VVIFVEEVVVVIEVGRQGFGVGIEVDLAEGLDFPEVAETEVEVVELPP
jgi:hypothetical protein